LPSTVCDHTGIASRISQSKAGRFPDICFKASHPRSAIFYIMVINKNVEPIFFIKWNLISYLLYIFLLLSKFFYHIDSVLLICLLACRIISQEASNSFTCPNTSMGIRANALREEFLS